MKNSTMKAAGWMAACFLFALTTAAPARAQVGIRVHVPFSFEVGAKLMPAGEYRVDRSALAAPSVLFVHSLDSNDSLAINPMPVGNPNAPSNPRLVFELLGSTYRLAQIWMPGSQAGAALPRTDQQTLVAKRQSTTKTVIIAAR